MIDSRVRERETTHSWAYCAILVLCMLAFGHVYAIEWENTETDVWLGGDMLLHSRQILKYTKYLQETASFIIYFYVVISYVHIIQI